MAFPAAAVILPQGIIFFISGLLINLIQVVCYVLIWLFSKNTYRKINRVAAELLWLELVWLIDWWAGVKIQIYAEDETFRSMGKEHALVICNHRSDIDWLVGWVLAQRSGCLGSTLAVMKKSSKFLPVLGWSMWFSEYLFLERSWAKDESTLKAGLQRLKDFPRPFWLALFVEGTRFTQQKLLSAQKYAASTGMEIPKNVLIPRTKGFVTAVSHMHSFVPAIYDVTVAIPESSPAPTMMRLFKGQPSVDALLDKHIAEDAFPSKLQDSGRPVKSFLVIIFWTSLLLLGSIKCFPWSSLLPSWKGLTASAIALATVTILMHILILFSQSEQSTSAKIAAGKAKKDRESADAGRKKQQ